MNQKLISPDSSGLTREPLPTRLEKALQSPGRGINAFDLPDHLNSEERHLVNLELAELRRMELPASQEQVSKTLAVLMVVLKMEKKPDMELDAMVKMYQDDLSDIPGDVMDAAAESIRKTATFFPTIAEIRSAAQVAWAPRHIRMHRLNRMLELPSEPRTEPTPEEKKRGLEVLENYRLKLARKSS